MASMLQPVKLDETDHFHTPILSSDISDESGMNEKISSQTSVNQY